jgi:thiamine biosynthesis lipoprotein
MNTCKLLKFWPLSIWYLILISCAPSQREYSYTKFILGGQCEIKFYYTHDRGAKEIINVIDMELITLDSLLSYFSKKSLVSELNHKLIVKAPSDVVHLISLSDSVSRLTNGRFDISVAPLLEIWGFYKGELTIPDTFEIEKTKKLVDYKRIQIKDDSIRLDPNMKIDFGGIAQGYAADRIAMILRQRHVRSAIINIAGEIVTIGKSPKDRPWRIGIKNPRGEGIIETIELQDIAVSTSGDYEKFFTIGNRRYPHIINPKTGFPASDFVSVTIFARDAAFADAIATAVATMNHQDGIKFLDSLEIPGIIYYKKNGVLQRLESE